jgi:hypothetical protein
VDKRVLDQVANRGKHGEWLLKCQGTTRFRRRRQGAAAGPAAVHGRRRDLRQADHVDD